MYLQLHSAFRTTIKKKSLKIRDTVKNDVVGEEGGNEAGQEEEHS